MDWGCIIYGDLATKNGSFMLGERMMCPGGLKYGHLPGTGPTTCQCDCNICLGRDAEDSNYLQNSKSAANPVA